jgi:hypothetical protein
MQANAVVQKHSLEGKSGDGKVNGSGRWSHVVDGRRTASDSAA